jgi:hypothetical protein
LSAEFRVTGAIDFTHAARAEKLDDLIVAGAFSAGSVTRMRFDEMSYVEKFSQ